MPVAVEHCYEQALGQRQAERERKRLEKERKEAAELLEGSAYCMTARVRALTSSTSPTVLTMWSSH